MQGKNDLVWQLISWGLVWNIVKAGGRARPAWIHDLQHLRVILTRKPSCLSGSWCVPGGFLSFQVVHRELTRQCPLLGSSWACPCFLYPPLLRPPQAKTLRSAVPAPGDFSAHGVIRSQSRGLCWVGLYSWNEWNSLKVGGGGGITAKCWTTWLGTENTACIAELWCNPFWISKGKM